MNRKIYLGLGSNLPLGDLDCAGILRLAIADIIALEVKNFRVSSFYKTPPWGEGAQNSPFYTNCIMEFENFGLNAFELLAKLQRIESRYGRERDPKNQNAARTLDIDIIDFCGQIYNGEENGIKLNLPHPLMHKRNFVLNPLMELNPNWFHPVLKTNINEIYSNFLSQDSAKAAIRDETY